MPDRAGGVVRRHLTMLLAGALLAGAPALRAAEGSPVAPVAGRGYLTFYLDNDLFGGTDRNYTNGARLSWISEGEPLVHLPLVREPLEGLATADASLVRALSGFRPESISRGTLELNYGLSLTQLMFTPEDFASVTQPPGQRRYAGWLGLGFSVHARDDAALNSAEFILGTTGPNSLAEDAQDLIHDLRDIEKFEGWDAQIPNEVTVDLVFTQKRRIRILDRRERGFSVDGLGEAGARLGTFRTDAFVGGFFRAGVNLPADFSDPRVSATSYSHQVFDRRVPERAASWSAYALFGLRGTAVGHDATLDGPLFSDFVTGNEREAWIGEVFLGFGARLGALELTYAHTWRSEEYAEQGGGSDFGSVAVRLRL